jgi:hypothetical protein
MLKNIFLAILAMTGTLCLNAQVPQALNYQAIARNIDGTIIPGQSVGVRFTILDGSASGTTVYQETHQTVTNNFGLFTLSVGTGTIVSGTIAAIDWSTGGGKYLKVEIAPQGGSNYTIQGTTQLLSVPYALYAEKTKLTGGNAITITNGNTISANYIAGTAITINGNTIAGNYQAGPGITINGNTISSNAGNAWLLNGNAGTTASHFLGTTDNLALRFRVNNSERFSISPVATVGTYNVSYVNAGDPSATSGNPTQFSINGKDISGSMLPLWVNTSTVGMTWSQVGGSNNTLGRLARWAQWTSNTNFQFYDQGIDQEGDFFITQRGLSGTGGLLPKKMLQISAVDNVGVNMDWAENPTANFHTKGTLRFEGINADNALTRILVMDVNGNVASRDASTITANSFWVADANGIHNNNSGHLGIGGVSDNLIGLNVEMMDNRVDGVPIARLASNDTWQTNLMMLNTSNNASYHLVVGGTSNIQPNYGVGVGGFGIVNVSNGSSIPLIISSANNVGIGASLGGTNNQPKARLHVQSGDVYIDQINSGVIMKSPNGQCWRMTVSNAGTPVFTSIPCP